ncbi:MAG TPA: DNA topoisomerase VI subunit B [archaeon]|nr:DNA topoisomerase VI subunit B [archaeon]
MAEQRVLTAEEMAKTMREVSVAEFFEKNRHLLGYENTTKALITIIKELVDNSLDACDEAGILPDIKVQIKEVGPDRFRISNEDNGPGVVAEKVPFAFGSLLYGSKFHRLRQSRGTQGIGVSGAILYSQLTAGKHAKVSASTGKALHDFEIGIDVAKNQPHVFSHKEQKNPDNWHGIRIEMEAEGRYIEGKQSVAEYLKQTAIANPHAKIVYDGPNGKINFDRVLKEVPKQPKEIRPHPYGIELGILRRMLAGTKARNVVGFLTSEFSRVGKGSAEQICKLAKIEFSRKAQSLTHEESERLHKAMQMVKLIAPPTDVLSPMGEHVITEGLKKELKADFYVAISRSPTVYRGYPFQVEVGIAYGGELQQEGTAQLFRFGNKVPLLYHQSDCATASAATEVNWRSYGLSQSGGGLPQGPVAILIHFASVWVPFTSEGKQAIAEYPEIVKEIKLALQDAGRKLSHFVNQRRRAQAQAMRRQIFERYMPVVAESLSKLTKRDEKTILKKFEDVIKKRAAIMAEAEKSEEENKEGKEDVGEVIGESMVEVEEGNEEKNEKDKEKKKGEEE